MPSKAKDITFLDIIILSTIMHNGGHATQKEVVQDANRWLEQNNVGPRYASRITSPLTVQRGVDKLRKVGFLEPEGGKYTLATKGRKFVKSLPDNWQEYPLFIPIANEKADLDNAIYAEDI